MANESHGVLVALQPFYPLPSVHMSHDSTPATKADLQALRVDLQREISALKTDLRSEIATAKSELRSDMSEFSEEIKRHFDVVAEHLSHDVLGALNDGFELYKDCRDNHERRIRRLERQAGVIA